MTCKCNKFCFNKTETTETSFLAGFFVFFKHGFETLVSGIYAILGTI